MTLSRIAFFVPSDPARLAAVLSQEGGECRDLDLSDVGMATVEMERNPGLRVVVAFDASSDPEGPLLSARVVLQDAGVPFWSVRDAFVDHDGTRRDGDVRLCLSGEVGDWSSFVVPWSRGEPAFDAATLLAAGVPDDLAGAAVSLLGPDALPYRVETVPFGP